MVRPNLGNDPSEPYDVIRIRESLKKVGRRLESTIPALGRRACEVQHVRPDNFRRRLNAKQFACSCVVLDTTRS